MDTIQVFLEVVIKIFLLFYAYHVYYYLGLQQGRKNGIRTSAEILEYAGESTAWAEKYKTFFELFYRKKRFHKYLVKFKDVEVDMDVKGNLVVEKNDFCKGQMIEIRYVVGKRGRLHIVQEETYKWFKKRMCIYTAIVFSALVIGMCIGYGIS